jgi:PAS domain S-box-containing protein
MMLRTRIAGALVTALAIVLAVTTVSWIAATTFTHTVARVEAGRALAESLHLLREDLIDIETGARGFAITGDEQSLEPYLRGRRMIPEHQQALAALLAGRSEYAVHARNLAATCDAKLEHAAKIVEARRSSGRAAALALIETRRGQRMMDDARAAIAELERTERTVLDRDTAQAHAGSRFLLLAAALSMAVMVVVVLAAMVMARRTILQPLAALASAARRAGTGAWERPAVTRDDELGTLERALATMVAQRIAAERRQRELVEDGPEPFFLADLDGRYCDVNTAACQLLGYTREELLGKTITDLIPPEDAPRLAEDRAKLLVPGTTVVGEWRLRTATGTTIPVEVSAKILHDGRWQAFVHDLTDRKRLEDERQAALRMRESLIAVVSHDLKSPLNAIELREHLLARGITDPKVREHSAAIRRAVVAMQRMIRGLLDAASIEAGQLRLVCEDNDLGGVVREVVDVLGPVAADQETELVVRGEPPHVLSFDRDRIAQVIYNLLGNALKFTPCGGRVSVELQARDGEIEVAIDDTGPGIAPEALPRIFDRFFTSGGRYSGTGLGLDIAKNLVEAHGGRIWATSTVGQGSSFRFALPLEAASKTTAK